MSDQPPQQPRKAIPRSVQKRATVRADSLVLVNTGDEKGKSTAAFGVMVRGWACGWRVGVVQFMVSDQWQTGERKLAEHLGIDWRTLGDGYTWDSTDLEQSAAKNREAWELARDKLRSGAYDLLILDELTYPINYGWIPIDDVVAEVASRATNTSVIITGRDAPPELIELASTATEMNLVKHAFHSGIKAKRGIEF